MSKQAKMFAPAEETVKPAVTYKAAGVDIDAGNALVEAVKPLAQSTRRPGVMAGLGGFGGLFDLKQTGFKDPVLVAANDGVGTKLKIAIETGRHETIGIDLVAMCVNDLVVQGAEPLFFLDYFATGKLEPKVAETVISGIAEGCRQAGCALIGGETAEMPGMYAPGDYDLAGFAVGAVERDAILPRPDIAEGDVLIGLASSGPHSNGYSLIRKLVGEAAQDRGEGAEAIWQDGQDELIAGKTLAEVFLTPTRIYVSSLLQTQRQTGAIKAMAHITGGGLTENLPRILPRELAAEIQLAALRASWRQNPVQAAAFHWLQEAGQIADAEMLRTFNCGVGMVLIVGRSRAEEVLGALNEQGETAFELGRLVKHEASPAVLYHGKLEFAP